MSLSNEERYAKMVHSICHINDLSEKLTDWSVSKLKNLTEKLWFEFLKKDSNGAFWLMGSDLSNDFIHSETLAGVAFSCHTVASSRGKLEEERAERDRFYESYKTLKGFVDMERLLDSSKGAALMIYLYTQNIAYAMCRYHDEFMDRYVDLNCLLRTMQGECFKLFKTSREYVYAWMVHNLCDKIFTMEENDIVNQWWVKHCIPHDVKLRFGDYEKVYEAYTKYQFRDMTVQDRIDVTLLLVGDKYGEYEHQHKEFMGMVKEYNKKNKVKIKVKPIEDAFANGQKVKSEVGAYERTCGFTSNYVDHNGEVRNIWGD